MAAYFIDLDGTFFEYGTMKPAPGWAEAVNRLMAEGHQVFFTTYRMTNNNRGGDHINIPNTKKWLKMNGIQYTCIIEGVESPRIIINDDGAVAINHPRNNKICYDQLCLK